MGRRLNQGVRQRYTVQKMALSSAMIVPGTGRNQELYAVYALGGRDGPASHPARRGSELFTA